MVSKKKREKLILQLLQQHSQLTLNQIHQKLPQNTKKQIYNALKSLFQKDQITTKTQRINEKPTTTYQLTNKP
jgi:predicted Zn-ribbon and HTH transcriptional regulator